MNDIIQTILVVLIIGYATWSIIRKFFWKPKRKASKNCGNDGCGCH
ncbi:FeoB-associated Cys-rich membrane protein [Winogradskyella immobilis]|uniref:FeoB-associated Cys-rich membrane protein n=1 Tax=Winogradskyella immobilis TaxID=2816852 RepID=A0ABS8EQG3_9FLAO|nr:FeoB-associated Cys-rich membrane protein [Winogradskyella immobilis]MCC1485222.1 FeoB-associated Cys-rich membrane protein [Winogradskyella immobilis]MCG0017314.1 FeoB-associated Cys-rich membrane protein [Winogradskyella immobilis]